MLRNLPTMIIKKSRSLLMCSYRSKKKLVKNKINHSMPVITFYSKNFLIAVVVLMDGMN